MRNRKDRRKPQDTAALTIEDASLAAPERRKIHDRRIANLNAEERQLLLSEMPGITSDKNPRKD
jgi:hypothetical protein